MPQHSDLTGSDLHETKGAESAAANTVHKANGSGGTSWSKIAAENINRESIYNINQETMVFVIKEPHLAFSIYIPIPWDCLLSVIRAAIDTAPAAALQVDFYNGSSTLIDSVSFSSTSSPGDTDVTSPSSNQSFSAGSVLRIRNSSAVASSGPMSIVLYFTRTG